MADVRIALDQFESGRLPRVCALTGSRTGIGELSVSVRSRVGAGWLLLLLGVVPFLIWRAVTRKTAVGTLPVSNLAYEGVLAARRRRTKTRLATSFAAFVVGVVVMFLIGGGVTALAPGGGLVGFLVAWALTPVGRWVPLNVDIEPSGRWVRIAGVDEAFARAIEGAHQDDARPAPGMFNHMASPPPTPPGWYSDPLQPTRRRYWDGASWTDAIA